MTIYGGGYKTWMHRLANKKDTKKWGYGVKIIPDMTPIHPFMTAFEMVCKEIQDLVFDNNPDIIERVCGDKTTEYEKKSSTMSYFCGIIENHIVHFVYTYLVAKGGILSQECLPELDGICLYILFNKK